MSVSSFLSREAKFAEAAVIALAATNLANQAGAIEEGVDTAAPQAVSAVIAAVEKADTVLGPAQRVFINGVLTTYQSQIEQELASLLPQANAALGTFVPRVVDAMESLAAKLQQEALATK